MREANAKTCPHMFAEGVKPPTMFKGTGHRLDTDGGLGWLGRADGWG